MNAARSAWKRLGGAPAPLIVGLTFAVIAIGVAFGEPHETESRVLAAALLIGHCTARGQGGWAVFFAASIPTSLGLIIHDLVGGPTWAIQVALIPLGMLAAAGVDRETRAPPGNAQG